MCVCVRVCVYSCACTLASALSHLWLSGALAHQAPLSVGILQARIPWWAAIAFSRGSSRPRDRTCVSFVFCVDRWVLYHECHLRHGLSQSVSRPIAWLMAADDFLLTFLGLFFPRNYYRAERFRTGALALLSLGKVKPYWTLGLAVIRLHFPLGTSAALFFVILVVPECLSKLRCSSGDGRAGRLQRCMLYYSLFGD